MRRFTILLLVLAVGAFIGSSLAFALQDHSAATGAAPTGLAMFGGTFWPVGARAPGGGDPTMFADPPASALKLLLALVWLAMLAHVVRTVLRFRSDRAAGGRHRALHARDHRLVEHGPLILSLLAAAAWPWVTEVAPVAGFLLALAMAAGAIGAALRGDRDGAGTRHRLTVGLYAGWAVAAMFTAFAGLLTHQLGVSHSLSSLVAIVLLAATAVEAQLRLGAVIGFTIAVVWALIGVAANAMQQDATVATAAVIAIAAMSTVLVRVTT